MHSAGRRRCWATWATDGRTGEAEAQGPRHAELGRPTAKEARPRLGDRLLVVEGGARRPGEVGAEGCSTGAAAQSELDGDAAPAPTCLSSLSATEGAPEGCALGSAALGDGVGLPDAVGAMANLCWV